MTSWSTCLQAESTARPLVLEEPQESQQEVQPGVQLAGDEHLITDMNYIVTHEHNNYYF